MIICACTDNNSYHITVLKSQGPSSIPHVTLLLDDSFTVFDVSLSPVSERYSVTPHLSSRCRKCSVAASLLNSMYGTLYSPFVAIHSGALI